MMQKWMLVAIVALAAGCAHAVDPEPTQVDDEAALASAGVPRGLYFLEGATPRKDAVLGLRLDASGKGHLLWSYSGDTRIERSCVVKAAVKRSGKDKKLELRCPADTLTFGLVKNEGDLVELTN